MRKISSFVWRTVFFSLIFLAIFFFFLISYFIKGELTVRDKIYPRVYVDTVNFGGKTKNDVESYFQQKNKKLKEVKIILIYKDNEVATFSGEIIRLRYDEKILANHAASIGRSTNFATRMYQKMKAFLNIGRFYFPAHVSFDKKPAEEYLTYLEEKYNQPAENALFNFEKGKVMAFKIEKNGLKILKEEALDNFESIIATIKNNRVNNVTIQIADEILLPEITLSQANDFGISEIIAEGKSDFTGSMSERIHNIILATSKFNGVLIPKEAIFSFNKTIGDISSSTGFKPAYIIKSGKTILGDGGGVCQVSTTLFRAALNAGLPIIERVAHAYRVSYYENDSKPGFDATVFDPTADLKFKNNTPGYILIQTTINKTNHTLLFTLYGKKDGRRTEISPVKIWDVIPPSPPLYQDDTTLKRGVKKQVDWAAWGAKTTFHYRVEKESEVLVEQDFFSSFRPWRAVYLIGTAE